MRGLNFSGGEKRRGEEKLLQKVCVQSKMYGNVIICDLLPDWSVV